MLDAPASAGQNKNNADINRLGKLTDSELQKEWNELIEELEGTTKEASSRQGEIISGPYNDLQAAIAQLERLARIVDGENKPFTYPPDEARGIMVYFETIGIKLDKQKPITTRLLINALKGLADATFNTIVLIKDISGSTERQRLNSAEDRIKALIKFINNNDDVLNPLRAEANRLKKKAA